MADNDLNFEWDEKKRQKIIEERGLDIVVLAPLVFADPNLVIKQDNRCDYKEERFLAYEIAEGLRLCVCFSFREKLIRLITIFKLNKKDWGKHYENEKNDGK